MKRRLPRPVFYGWYIVGAGAVSNFIVLGTVMIGFGTFVRPLREELGWSGAAIGLGISLRSLEQGLLSPLTGLVVDRVGPRRVALFGIVVLAVGVLLFSQARTVPVYLLASVIMSLGMSLTSGTAYPAAIMNWFQRKRGRAMGLLSTGNAAGWFVPSVILLLMAGLGWRSTAIVAAVAILVVGIPAALVIRDRPEAYGDAPDGDVPNVPDGEASPEATGVPAASSATGMGAKEAARTPALYLLAVASGLSAVALVGWTVFQFDHLQTAGFSTVAIGVIVPIYAVVQVTLRYLVGWFGDAVGRRRLFIVSFLAQGAGLLVFAQLSPERLWLLPFYYVVFGFGHAAWIVLQMAVIADYFGSRRFGTVRGMVSAIQMPASLAAPLIAGLSLDMTGDYVFIFTAYAIATATGALWVSLIRRPPWSGIEGSGREGEPVAERREQAMAPGPA